MTYLKRHTLLSKFIIKPIALGIRHLTSLLLFVGSPFYYLLAIGVKTIVTATLVLPFIFQQIQIIPKRFRVFFRLVLGTLLLFIMLCGVAFWYYILRGLPDPRDLSNRQVDSTTKIYDRNGTLLYKIYKDQNRTPVELSEVPLHVKLAFLAAEDSDFYKHAGFSVRGISRAAYLLLTKQEITGGSTITQQLVKNAFLSPEQTIERKLKEIVLSVETEHYFSKDDIFEMYINEVGFGGTVYGIREAASVYLEKDVNELSLGEAALLAGLPKSPTAYSPFGSTPEHAFARQKEILNLMVLDGFITQEQADGAMGENITFSQNRVDIKAPHFVMYVREQLAARYGEETVSKGGLNVVTTLDYSIQQMAEKIVLEEVDKLGSLHVSNGAAIVIDPKTGEILAMVGSRDFFDTEHDGNVNVLTRLRQPGSSIKLVNYTYALSHGYTPATILDDSPVSFPIAGQPPYSPKNYDGRYRGKVTLRSAFAESRNIPAVRVLASYGVEKMIDMGEAMGITTWTDRTRYGLSLTLGGGDVYLLDLAYAYATIANYGERPLKTSIISISDVNGEQLYERECLKSELSKMESSTRGSTVCEGVSVVDPRVSYQVISILSDNKARTPAFGSSSALNIPGHPEVAVKTGTSNSLKDNVTVGFSQNYLVATWVGNNDSSPMSRVASGVTGASPIWNKIMNNLLVDTPSIAWDTPERMRSMATCLNTTEWFLEENVPSLDCESIKNVAKSPESSGGTQNRTPEAIARGVPGQTQIQ